MIKSKTECQIHQQNWLDNNAFNISSGLFWTMRTGKTKTILENIKILYNNNKIEVAIILAPNGVHDNWINIEAEKHLYKTKDLEKKSYNASEYEKDKLANEFEIIKFNKSLNILSFSHSILTVPRFFNFIEKILKVKKSIIIFDECHYFKNVKTQSFKKAVKLADLANYKRILTGTAVTEKPIDIYGQLRLLSNEVFDGEKYKDFERRICNYKNIYITGGRRVEVIKGFKNLDIVTAEINKYCDVISRSDMDNFSDLKISEVKVELSKNTKETYKNLKEKLILEMGDEVLTVQRAITLMSKLHQILSGFLLNEFGEVIRLSDEKHKKALEIIQEHDTPIIVWCKFIEDIEYLSKELVKNNISHLTYYGKNTLSEKQLVRDMFLPNKNDTPKVLIANPQIASTGLNLSAANRMLWFSLSFKNIDFTQANERCTHGNNASVDIKVLNAGEIDTKIIKALNNKTKISDYIMKEGF